MVLARKQAATRPALAGGRDAEVAAKLRDLVRDASDGLRRIIIAGMFIERIVRELPHGRFIPWLETNCPDIHRVTVFRWRDLARCVAQAAGVDLGLPDLPDPTKLLMAPADELPEQHRSARERIDALMDGKTARQLFLDFKQAEERPDGSMEVKVGRVKGQGGRPPQAPLATQAELQRQLAHSDWAHIDRCLMVSYRARFALLDDLAITAQISALEQALMARKAWLKCKPELRQMAALDSYFNPHS